MDTAKRHWITISIFIAAIGVGFIVSAFATDHWIMSEPKGNATNQNSTGGSSSGYTANITFGLFTGSRSIDYGIGRRTQNLICECTQILNRLNVVFNGGTSKLVQYLHHSKEGSI